MPMPVSVTANRTSQRPSSSGRAESATRTSPRGVNLTALLSRLRSTWRVRPRSPTSASGVPSAIEERSASPCRAAMEPMISRLSSSTSRRTKGARSTVSRLDSMREKSRMSLISSSRASPLTWMACTYSRWRGSREVPASRSAMPMTPFIGVRISWLMLARNSLLARLAERACSIASSSERVRSGTCSSRRRRSRSSSSWTRRKRSESARPIATRTAAKPKPASENGIGSGRSGRASSSAWMATITSPPSAIRRASIPPRRASRAMSTVASTSSGRSHKERYAALTRTGRTLGQKPMKAARPTWESW